MIGWIIGDAAKTVFCMREFYRKIVHIGFGLAIAALVFLTEKEMALSILLLGTLIGLIFTDAILKGYRIPVISHMVDRFERKEELPGKGALFFAVSCLVCVFFFPKEIVIPAIIAFSLLDGIAAISGQYLGRHTIYRGKTVEGTVTGIAVTFIILLLFLPAALAALAVIVAGLIELLSPFDDNLLILPGVCVALSLAGVL
jgi:phytol kinase